MTGTSNHTHNTVSRCSSTQLIENVLLSAGKTAIHEIWKMCFLITSGGLQEGGGGAVGNWGHEQGSDLWYVRTCTVCVSGHKAARTPWVPVNAFYHEHHFCFDAVTNSRVTQPLPSRRHRAVESACHSVLMSCFVFEFWSCGCLWEPDNWARTIVRFESPLERDGLCLTRVADELSWGLVCFCWEVQNENRWNYCNSDNECSHVKLLFHTKKIKAVCRLYFSA